MGTLQHSTLCQDGRDCGNGFAWLSFSELTIFSCYFKPGAALQEYLHSLRKLETTIRAWGNASIILAGDFNAWNIESDSRTNNLRGIPLSNLASSLGLIQDPPPPLWEKQLYQYQLNFLPIIRSHEMVCIVMYCNNSKIKKNKIIKK